MLIAEERVGPLARMLVKGSRNLESDYSYLEISLFPVCLPFYFTQKPMHIQITCSKLAHILYAIVRQYNAYLIP
jgi:hypothetical protein